jgi:hypothetical protein
MTGRYHFAEPESSGCFVPRSGDYARAVEILNQASGWYGTTVNPPRSTMRPTEVLRLDGDVDSLNEQQQKAWIEFASLLGVDPARVRNKLVIMQDDDGYHLHLSVKTPGPSGKGDLLDLATNDVVSTPLVIDLGHERNWPGADDTE